MSKILGLRLLTGLIVLAPAATAQSSLTLGSGTAAPGGTVSLNLSLSSPTGSAPAGIEWTLNYPAADISSVNVLAGSSATAAGKSLSCAPGTGVYTCILSGANGNGIANGVVAVLTATLSANPTTAAIGVTDPIASSAAGEPASISASGGTVEATSGTTPVTVTSLVCNPGALGSNAAASCTVTLSQAAPSGGVAVQLAASIAALAVPASVTVAANANTAAFTASTGTLSSGQTGRITASLNGSSQSTSLTLTASPTLTGVQCSPATLAPNASATCTVTLSEVVSTDPVVTLSDSSQVVTVPASLSVPANAASVSFTATAGSFSAAGAVSISAAMGGNTVSTTLLLAMAAGPAPPNARLILNGSQAEVSGTASGSAVNPQLAPAGFAGEVTVNGSGSVNFAPGKGVYFLSCCTNSNNAYYKFTGATIGQVFNMAQGQISFALESRYSFAQRQATAAAPRYAFDVRDGNGHQFFFLTEVISGSLIFTYMAQGTAQYYYVPAGTEDQLFGNGVSLNVALQWDGSNMTLLLNGEPVKSTPYTAAAENWNTSSNFDLGAYEYLTAGGYNVSDDVISNFTVTAPGGFELTGGATELSAVNKGSVVTPTTAPAGVSGTVVMNGSGSVNFVPGKGVYFLNCCANSNNAYYKFTGAATGQVFNMAQGQISFALESRYSFAQRQATAAAPRYAFDVRDGNGHQFFFLTEVISGSLIFTYMVQGTAQYYYVPAGTEDQLFGKGVSLSVGLQWDGSNMTLLLNGEPVKSTPYTPAVENWSASSNFDLGAYEYLTAGGYNVSDDAISNFTVTTRPSSSAAAAIRSSQPAL